LILLKLIFTALNNVQRFFKINYLLQYFKIPCVPHLTCYFTVQFSLTFPRHCALNAISAILTEGASLKQIIKIRDLVNTF